MDNHDLKYKFKHDINYNIVLNLCYMPRLN